MAVKLKLTHENYKWIAEQIHKDCMPEMVMAVSRVECKREPFDRDGFPAILFERHVFYRSIVKINGKLLADEIAKDHPSLCYHTGYGRGGYGSYSGQRTKFSAAFQIHQQAAMMACSWGAFQELGENYADYGFKTVNEFVDMMKNGLYGQAYIFIKSIKSRKLTTAFVDRKFSTIALKYNGTGYREFKYDEQIEAEFKIAVNMKIDWTKVKSEAPQKATNPVWIGDLAKNGTANDLVSPTEEKETDPEHEDPILGEEEKVAIEKPATEDFLTQVKTEIGALAGGNITVDGVVSKAQETGLFGLPSWFWFTVVGILAVGSITYLIIRWKKHKSKEQRDLELTQELVKANSNDYNKVVFFCKEEADEFKSRGYKLVWR